MVITKVDAPLPSLPMKENIVSENHNFRMTLEMAKRAAASSSNILIQGESGTGKEILAKYIHQNSKQRNGPFVAINCSSIPELLLESELFGNSKGAFTGAFEQRAGLFEEAANGSVFLDEIGDLQLSLQAKILRAVEERKIKRVGENKYRNINCRFISATHLNLAQAVNDHRFREDLYFRLCVIPIYIAPLRERKEDILLLAKMFLDKFNLENDSPGRYFSPAAVDFILNSPWRGNIRELRNTIERAVVLSQSPEIGLNEIQPADHILYATEPTLIAPNENTFSISCESQLPPLTEVIRKYIAYAVAKKGGARDKTAKELGIDRKTLYKRL
jgi:transcriptional regulator with PAS, ATPase and Fis domain